MSKKVSKKTKKDFKLKNGFTLVELLVTVAIISLILGIAIYSVNSAISNSKKESYTLAVNNIKKSANTYAKEYLEEINWDADDEEENLTKTCVSVQTLVNKGYLEKKVLEDNSMPKSIIVTKDKNDTIVSEEEFDDDCDTYSNTVPIPTSKSLCYKVTYDPTVTGHDLIKDDTLIETGNYKKIEYEDTTYNNDNLPKDAGEYKVKLTLKDGKQWRDNTNEPKIVTCSIEKAEPKLILDPSGSDSTSEGLGTKEITLTSDVEGTITLKSSNEDYAKASVENNEVQANINKTIKVTNIATRDTTTYITVTLNPTNQNYKIGSIKYTIGKINQKTVEKPTSTICNNLTYNGDTQILANESEGYKLYNNTAINYGTYTITAKLNYGYQWQDNSTNPIEFTCEIKRPTPTITYKDATCNPTTKTVIYDEKYGDLCLPIKTGYTFIGWYTDSNFSNLITKDTTISNFKNHDLYAKWETNTYTVTLSTGTGISAVSGTGKYKYGESVKIDAKVATGYTWSNWTGTNNITTKSYTFTMPASNVTYTANAIANTYTVKYDANGGTGTMTNSSHTYDVAKNLTTNTYTRIGYKFNDWNTKSDGSGTSYKDGQSVSNLTSTNGGTVTLYAQWTPYKVIIKYNVNGGTITSSTIANDVVNTWTVDEDGTIYKSANGETPTATWHTVNYGTNLVGSGLADWCNSTWIDVKNGELIGKAWEEWICLGGNCEKGKTYDQLINYSAEDFCDASYGDCTVELGVNWVEKIYRVSTSEGGNGISIKCYTDNLEDAILYADETTYNTIRMLKSKEETGNIIFNKSLIFRVGSGYTLTLSNGPLIIAENATVTKSSGGTITGTGEFTTMDVYGKLIVNEGNVTAQQYTPIYTHGTSQLEINGGTISASTSSSGYWAIRNESSYKITDTNTTDDIIPCRDEEKCAVKITGGTLNGNGGGLYSDTDGDILVTGGTFNSTHDFEFKNNGSGSFYINGGTIGSASDNLGAINNASTGRIDIGGGTITCGSVICARNSGTGTLRMLHGTLTSAATGLYNQSTGKLVIGLSVSAGGGDNPAIVKGTGEAQATVVCGNITSGSHAICHVNAATISTADGYGVINYNGTYRQYKGSTVKNTSSKYPAINNRSTSYTEEDTPTGSEYSTYYWGGVFIRQGYVEATKGNAIYNQTLHSHAVRIGNTQDALFTSTTIDVNQGPTVRGSLRGVHSSNTTYKYLLNNGIVCGTTAASNVTPTTGRTGYKVPDSAVTSGSYKCFKLTAK